MHMTDKALQNVRETFGKKLVEIGEKYPQVVVVTADLIYPTRSNFFAEKFPTRLVDVGIAEQNCVSVAAGLATCGKIPLICEYAHFVPLRAGEQLRNDIAYTNLNVKIFEECTGLTFGVGGATHQTFEDIAIVRSIPNMTVVVPSDANESAVAIEASINYQGPVYVRLGRDNEYVLNATQNINFQIGKSIELTTGTDVTIIACGPMVYEAVQASKLLRNSGIAARVINMHTVKPIDKQAIINAATTTKGIVTVEEHNTMGGLGSAVLEVLSGRYACPVTLIGLEDVFPIIGPTFEIRKHYGLCYENIATKAKEILEK
jgi:transketolase